MENNPIKLGQCVIFKKWGNANENNVDLGFLSPPQKKETLLPIPSD
jgi:hypothetical protein